MLENYHKWDKVSCFPKTHPFPGGCLCLHLRDDPRLRKRGAPIFPFLVPSRSSMTWSTACSTTGPWNNIHRFKENQYFAVITKYVPGWSMQRRGYWRCDKCENYGWYQGGLVSFICLEKQPTQESSCRWVLWGVNCGEQPYPGGYDWYPCQHERFIQQVILRWWQKSIPCSLWLVKFAHMSCAVDKSCRTTGSGSTMWLTVEECTTNATPT